MKTESKTQASHSIVQQTKNNTTSWIGHHSRENEDIVSGQTFIATAEGDLDQIEVFSNMVASPGKMTMTLYQFDPLQKSWGSVLGTACIEINQAVAGEWVSFNIPGTHLDKGKSYGFRLESKDTLIGLGEAAGPHHTPPFAMGQEWQFSNNDKNGHSFSYFSLAFKVGLRA